MRMRIMTVLLALFLAPAAASAQSWSADEQEIIDLNQTCWDAWASQDLTRVEATCNEHQDARGWWTANAAPDNGWYARNATRWMTAIGSQEKWIYWEINPLSVSKGDPTGSDHCLDQNGGPVGTGAGSGRRP